MKRTVTAIAILIALLFTFIPQSALAAEDINSYKPYGLTAVEMAVDGTHPFGSAVLTLKIDNLPGDTGDSVLTWYVGIEKKIGAGDWMGVALVPSVTFLEENQKTPGVFTYEQLWNEDYDWNGTNKISYRAYVVLEDLVSNGGGQTGYSNEASLGLMSSAWAVPELEKADELGLIPNILKGADMTKPITREEFCELAVLLYDMSTGTPATPVPSNPFNDTQNQQILKAYNLGITTGTSTNTFSPKVLISREQCAAMLFRAIKAIAPTADYSIAGVPDFPDQKYISGYAVEATKYMSKIGIITGDAQGKFMPQATMKAGEAAGYGMATREQAIAMSVRTYEKI